MIRPKIVGIVNITTDSFSDGGKFIEPKTAIEHAKKLLRDDADIIELSGASSNPHSEPVRAEMEIERIQAVLRSLDCPISIDATKPEVQRFALSKKVAYINDIRGFPEKSMYDELASSDAKLIVMHFISDLSRRSKAKADLDKAMRVPKSAAAVFDSIIRFFDTRLPQLQAAGVAQDRIIIDPGMGFFLASNPEPSLAVLAHISDFKKRYGLPVMISVSRKSFLRNLAPLENRSATGVAAAAWGGFSLTGRTKSDDVDIQSRTLAAELFAAQQGVDYIRTHDVRALHQALQTLLAIDSAKEYPF